MATKNKTTELTVEPLRGTSAQFGPAVSKYHSFACVVPGGTTKEQLESPKFWVHYARLIPAGSEIRCVADDSSFVAYLICTFSLATDARMKCTGFHKLDDVMPGAADAYPGYEVVNGGAAGGWFIRVKSTGERLFGKGYPTQGEAFKALDQHVKALAA